MKLQQYLLTGTAAALTLIGAACGGGGSSDDEPTGSGGSTTLKQFAVNDLDNNTSDTAKPIEINDLTIDDTNEEPDQYDDVLQSN